VLPGGGDLLFCAHHGREHATRIREVAVEIHDTENVLGGKPASPELDSPSAN
jgi:hypothetical protein